MRSPLHPLHLVLGLIVWCVWFVVLYGGLSLVCELAPPDVERGALTWVNLVILLAALLVASLLGMCAWRCWQAAPEASGDGQGAQRFIGRIGAAVHGMSAVAALVLALPGLVLAPCV